MLSKPNTDPIWVRLLPGALKSRLEGRDSVQRVIGNTGWLFADRLTRMGVGLIVGVWVARYLGPEQFGLLNFSAALVALSAVLASLGLDGIVVREILRAPEERNNVLGAAFFLRIFGGGIALLGAVIVVSILRPEDSQSRNIVAILACGTLFQSLDVIDFWFQSRVSSKHAIYPKSVAFLLAASLRVTLILLGAPLVAFAWASLFEAGAGAIGMIVSYRRQGQSLSMWRATSAWVYRLLADGWPLILSALSVVLYMKIDQVMLGEMAGDEAVGIYAAATRVSELWYFIPVSIVSSLFPAILRTREVDESLYYRRLQRLFSLMAALAIGIAIPMTFLSGRVVVLLFGDGFAAAGPVLALHIWAALFVFFGVAQGAWDLAENLTKLALVRVLCGALLNIALNALWIPTHGPMGAAAATVVSYGFASVLLNAIHPRTRGILTCQFHAVTRFRYLLSA